MKFLVFQVENMFAEELSERRGNMKLVLTIIAVVILLVAFIVNVVDLYMEIKYGEPLIEFKVKAVLSIIALAISYGMAIIGWIFY